PTAGSDAIRGGRQTQPPAYQPGEYPTYREQAMFASRLHLLLAGLALCGLLACLASAAAPSPGVVLVSARDPALGGGSGSGASHTASLVEGAGRRQVSRDGRYV